MNTRMPVYFIRHKFKQPFSKTLKERGLVAYNYINEYHDVLKNYSEQSRGLTQAFKAFHQIEKTGAVIVCEFMDTNVFWIGEIRAGEKETPVEIEHNGERVLFKTLKMENQKQFCYADTPLLAAIRPPYTTVCAPGKSYCQRVYNLYYGDRSEISTELLHPSSIELMCEAFLRSELAPDELQIEYTLLRTGKTMPAVDIFAKTVHGKKLYAQVTYASERSGKMKDLVEFAGGKGIVVHFSKDKMVKYPGVDFHFCIDDVFSQFQHSQNSKYQIMLQEMSGLLVAEACLH